MKQKKLGLLVVSLLILALVVFPALAQKKGGSAEIPQNKITVKGKILYMKALGGYYLLGEDPPGEMIIENQNPRQLKALHKSGKVVTVEGHNTIGADRLFIEKIDGKKYRGKGGPSK